MPLKVLNIAGARPNFMKIAPIIRAMGERDGITHKLVHTGQHYDAGMSQAFFHDLGLPKPDIDLGVGSASHAVQTARIMTAFEEVCLAEKPDVVLVVGDVNSTLACALTAGKLGIAVAHVEAGLRSRDMTMPEEINRLCTDAISDLLFTTDRLADQNLLGEGIAPARIHFVGNVMIDTLLACRETASVLPGPGGIGARPGGYGMLTLHRPSNVDDPVVLGGIIRALAELAGELPLVFPVHPRTRPRLCRLGLEHLFCRDRIEPGRILLTEPLGYLHFLSLNMHARLVLTDSGGLQEETTVLQVPCLTVRENTERPITVEQGTNKLVGTDPNRILAEAREILGASPPRGQIPEKWDGHAADRIVDVLLSA